MEEFNPEITIIMPIIDRLATFNGAVRIALSQELINFEVIIALSGCDNILRDAAKRWQSFDSRIRIVDAPGSPNMRTGIARHQAIEAARSDKILILQDDDDWNTMHAKEMSDLLDFANVAINPVRAVTLSHREMAWHPGLHLHRNRVRTLETGKKRFYEAHYCFRRKFYLDSDIRWDKKNLGNIGLSGVFSKTVLGTDLEQAWGSGTAVTSWSLNSPPRRNAGIRLSAEQRATERDDWREKRSRQFTGNPIWIEHFFQELGLLRHRNLTYPEVIEELGLRELGLLEGTEEDVELRIVHGCLTGRAQRGDDLVAVLGNSLETGQGYFMDMGIAHALVQDCESVDQRIDIVLQAAEKETGLRKAQCLMFAGVQCARSNSGVRAGDLLSEAVASDHRILAFAAPAACVIAERRGDFNALLSVLSMFGDQPNMLPDFDRLKNLVNRQIP